MFEYLVMFIFIALIFSVYFFLKGKKEKKQNEEHKQKIMEQMRRYENNGIHPTEKDIVERCEKIFDDLFDLCPYSYSYEDSIKFFRNSVPSNACEIFDEYVNERKDLKVIMYTWFMRDMRRRMESGTWMTKMSRDFYCWLNCKLRDEHLITYDQAEHYEIMMMVSITEGQKTLS